nr:hypothetical protein [Pseudomonas syringae pv. actinidiae]
MATNVVFRGLQHFLPVLIGLACIVGLLMFLQHRDQTRMKENEQRFERCKAESLNPPPPFKSSLDCIGWQEKYKPKNPGFPVQG